MTTRYGVKPALIESSVVARLQTKMVTWKRCLAPKFTAVSELMLPEEAFRTGFVDALADDPGHTREAALGWARDVAALPSAALVTTRRTARADPMALFDDVNDKTCQAMSDVSFSKETQKALHALVERLAST